MVNISLGRGLNSLIPSKKDQKDSQRQAIPEKKALKSQEEKIIGVEIEKVFPNPYQPRHNFNHQDLEELVDSIKVHGIIQPLIVSQVEKGYQLVAGERRLRAAQLLDFKKVPVIVRKTEGRENLELAIVENIQRKDLNPLEKARAYERLMEEFNLTQEEVGKKIGKSRALVANTLRLLGLPEEIKKAIEENKISEGHARSLVGIKDQKEQRKLFYRVLKENLSVRQTEWGVKKSRAKNKPQPQQILDLILEENRDTLRQAVGTKVDIEAEKEGGKIVIYFYSKEELKEIISKISK